MAEGTAEVGARQGLYLLRTVVKICQDIKSLKHSTHSIDDDEGHISLQDSITQPAQVAARGRRVMVQGLSVAPSPQRPLAPPSAFPTTANNTLT